MAKLTMTRRSFMKVAAATAAAAAVTGQAAGPLAALAQDGDAAASVGDVKRIRSCCRGCGKMECGVWVTVQNGRAIKIEGDDSAFQSMGNRCTKSIASLQAAYHPDRLLYPMKRTNPKGEDPGWVRVTWEEGLALAAKGMQEVIDKYGPESIWTISGTSRMWPMATYMGFRQLYGCPDHVSAWNVCKGPRHFAGALMDESTYAFMETVGRPKVYVQWAASPEISNYDDAARTIVDVQQKADVYINVNPRQSHLGKEADIWLPLRTGTDGAMALSWANVIIENKLYDEKFIKRWTNAAFLVCDDIEPSGYEVPKWTIGTYEMKTRLLKESDLIEGGKQTRFMVWDTLAGRLTYFDAAEDVALWEGEVWTVPTEGKEAAQEGLYGYQSQGWVPNTTGFDPLIDPALEGEFEVTLKDGRTSKVKPVWEHYRALCAEYTPEMAAEITGVPAETIELAAKTYATRIDPDKDYGNGGIHYELGVEHGCNSTNNCRAIMCIVGMTGNFDTPGGNRGSTRASANSVMGSGARAVPPPLPPMMDKILGGDKSPLLTWWQMWSNAGEVYKAALTGEPRPMKGAICQAGDFMNQSNATAAWEALKQTDFFIDIDLWHHPTAELADVIFPAQHWLEIPGFPRPSQGSSGALGATVRCIEPPGETMYDIEFNIAMFKAMGVPWDPDPSDPWPSIEKELKIGLGRNQEWADFVQEFQENGWIDVKVDEPEKWGTYKRYEVGIQRGIKGLTTTLGAIPRMPGFNTPTKKFEIWSTVVETFHPGEGLELPVYTEPFCSPVSTPEVFEEYPLTCITGRRIPVYFHSEHRQLPWCREQWPVPRMEIHPETAASLGIKQGDWCWIESPHGKVRQVADLFYGIARNAINCEHQWWLPELPAPEHGHQYVSINHLVDVESYDKLCASSQLRGYAVKVYKAEEGAPPGMIESAADPRLKDWLPVYEGRA